jgi:hypothetical protein
MFPVAYSSVLPLPVGPDHHSAKKGLILTMKLWKMKKSSDSDHEIMNLVEKNVGTPAILRRALIFQLCHQMLFLSYSPR